MAADLSAVGANASADLCSGIGGGANAPLPWVGFYIAMATLACCLLMAADVISGVRHRKFHFPSQYFSINSATLALLGIATKLPADLTTSMPSRYDQLSKLSGTALLCTAITNSMPSLISMTGSQLVANTIAVSILVVTVAVDVGIQMGTHIIYKFRPENAALLILLLLLLILLPYAAFYANNAKENLQRYYDYNCCSNQAYPVGDRVRESLKFFWVTANFFSPQYVFGYSEVCAAPGALSVAVAGVLVEALVRSATSTTFCEGTSDYSWSTTVVLFVQVVTVGVGTIAPACRWLSAVRFFPDSHTQKCLDDLFNNKSTLNFGFFDYYGPKKRASLLVSIWFGLMIIVTVLVYVPIFFASILVRYASIRLGRCWKKAIGIRNPKIFLPPTTAATATTAAATAEEDYEKEDFVVNSHGEVMLVRKNLHRLPKGLNWCIQKGASRQPTRLMELVQQHSTASDGFTTAGMFDHGGRVPEYSSLPELPECWGLPIVTLAAIAASLPGLEEEFVLSFLDGVRQGIKYVMAVDEYRPSNRGHPNLSMRKATQTVWTDLYLLSQWVEEDLRDFRRNKNGRSVLERLKGSAAQKINQTVLVTRLDNTPREVEEVFWLAPVALASTYMYRVSKTILENCEETTTSERLFVRLRTMILDNIAACLTNLPSAIYNKCVSCATGDMERNVSNAAQFLGEVENILKFLEDEKIARLYPQRRECVGEWRRRRHDHPSTSSV